MSESPKLEHDEVRRALETLLSSQKVLKLATAGGTISPWITSTYFSESSPFSLSLTLEQAGKGMSNIAANPRVAVAIDAGTPFTVFAQGEARARIATGPEAESRLLALRRKVPEIEPLLRGALHVIAIDVSLWRVTSFADGWFPARSLEALGQGFEGSKSTG